MAQSGACYVALPGWASRLDRRWSSQQQTGAGSKSGRSGGAWRRAVDETSECVTWRVRHSDVHAHPSQVRKLCANALVRDGAGGGGDRARLLVSSSCLLNPSSQSPNSDRQTQHQMSMSCWAAHVHMVARASNLASVAIGYAQLCANKSRKSVSVAFKGWLGLSSLTRAMLRSHRIADSAVKVTHPSPLVVGSPFPWF